MHGPLWLLSLVTLSLVCSIAQTDSMLMAVSPIAYKGLMKTGCMVTRKWSYFANQNFLLLKQQAINFVMTANTGFVKNFDVMLLVSKF